MSFAVGFDLVAAEEVQEAIAAHGRRYLERVYSEEELRDCREDPVRLAQRFAVKEATMKALDRRDEPLPWREITLGRDQDGRPSVILSGAAAAFARERGVESLSVSVSRTRGLAGAIVLAQAAERR
jgi:holo-[acyl-carrier protein] synthase